MGIKTKATLILVVILAAVGLLVYLLIYGGMKNNSGQTEELLPSDQAAQAYVINQKLLASVTEIKKARPGGPVFKMVQGTDANGNAKVVWLVGTDQAIRQDGSVLLKDGVSRDEIVAKLKDLGIAESDILDLYVTPHDYNSDKIIWFAQEKGDRKHMFWFDFHTGEKIWEAFQDPTAWKLGGS